MNSTEFSLHLPLSVRNRLSPSKYLSDTDLILSMILLIAFAGTDPSVKESGTSIHRNGIIISEELSGLWLCA